MDELKFVMRHLEDKMTEEEIEEMIREADHDNDGQISYDGNNNFTHFFQQTDLSVNKNTFLSNKFEHVEGGRVGAQGHGFLYL